jgi:hypothetical protein
MPDRAEHQRDTSDASNVKLGIRALGMTSIGNDSAPARSLLSKNAAPPRQQDSGERAYAGQQNAFGEH